ncbi:hypothetical protein GCM10022223_69690 [Kineosporia mesophila]|uniref:Uncharacterized protein n=1 Tax=Kineosporia mesophila TaxID=566012 RepID=A0ABP7AU28_9ACTN|nr:hypothetical protein [Kineosporia mesophila]MCD5352343.1 hypothetical protein [Kineosporia mesophila]
MTWVPHQVGAEGPGGAVPAAARRGRGDQLELPGRRKAGGAAGGRLLSAAGQTKGRHQQEPGGHGAQASMRPGRSPLGSELRRTP